VLDLKKERIPLPKPRSNFFLLQCLNCGNEQIVFSCTTIDLKCKVCGNLIAEKTGGRAKIHGTIVRKID